ncbi:outer membrane protein assembly factor BamB family protein [Streptomyces guryensis]|uniref:PQQ-like beta-propeller repeat protein n=1 Tax=Streptomyces guryensis TaxID=2886947 RepID=A0A9Q3ZC55_9ACTN|nr:PQQ-binding-like beta-propeller repeat protein [Streptomyces guryensis]MCD9879297.1 PQQ-like beta-propeller repeat protein [Streptomyces guryensis]
MKRRIVAVGAALLVLVGCAGNTASGGPKSPAVASPSGGSEPTVETSPTSVSGPWRAWTASLSSHEAHGSCGATAHQVVCATDSGGFVGRSRADGRVTWTVPAGDHGKSAGLVVDAADERAVTGVAGVLHAANLRTGTQAWTHQLPTGRAYFAVGAADGIVYALDAPDPFTGTAVLDAVRASDGTPLWHRTIAWSTGEPLAAFRGRVYTADGTRVTARDARSGDTVAAGPTGVECPHLVTGGHYLVCTGSPISAGDTFAPMRHLDPATLRPLPTPRNTADKPVRGVISEDGVLVLYEAGAEDTSAGNWNAYDLENDRRLWSTYATEADATVADGRFVTFTPVNDRTSRGRVITIDLHAGPQGTGTAAPRMSAAYPQTRGGEYPVVVAPGGDTGHVVVMARTHASLRSLPLP